MTLEQVSSQLEKEYDRQVANLIEKGYPQLANLPDDDFRRLVQPLRDELPNLAETLVHAQPQAGDADDAAPLPFVIVVGSQLAPPHEAILRVRLGRKEGWTEMTADELATFGNIPDVPTPASPVYLITGVDLGHETLNVTPNDALVTITGQRRSPLTINEGIAVLTHHPEVLKKRNAFSVLASRCGDRRVPALWISKGSPRLGWCWAGNPHTWLGSASCAARIG